MAEDVLETEAVEMEVLEGEEPNGAAAPRPLPATAESNDISPWRGEVKTAALAAAGGLVAGAATAVVVRATSRGSSGRKPARRAGRKERPLKVIASRSFLVDVHLVDR
jgi:hypothetical protein